MHATRPRNATAAPKRQLRPLSLHSQIWDTLVLTTTTTGPRLVSNSSHSSLTLLEARSPRSGCRHVSFLLGALLWDIARRHWQTRRKQKERELISSPLYRSTKTIKGAGLSFPFVTWSSPQSPMSKCHHFRSKNFTLGISDKGTLSVHSKDTKEQPGE